MKDNTPKNFCAKFQNSMLPLADFTGVRLNITAPKHPLFLLGGNKNELFWLWGSVRKFMKEDKKGRNERKFGGSFGDKLKRGKGTRV